MAATVLPPGGIALHGAPDSDIGTKDGKHMPMQAIQLEMTQDIVDELLDSVRSRKPPQIFFGRTPVRVLLLCSPIPAPLNLLARPCCFLPWWWAWSW